MYAIARLLDHLVGALLEEPRQVEAERLGGHEIDDQLEFGRNLTGRLAGLEEDRTHRS